MYAYANCPKCGRGLQFVDVFVQLGYGFLYCNHVGAGVNCRWCCMIGRVSIYSGLLYYDLDSYDGKRWWINLGDRPVLTGKISVLDGNERKEVGKVALWYSKVRGDKAPKFDGNVEVGGDKYRIALWDNNGQLSTEAPKPSKTK